MRFSDIKGQDNAVRYLSRLASSGEASKSLVFSGPEGVGRSLAAKAFIARLFCAEPDGMDACGACAACARTGASDHPDVLWIRPEKNRKIRIEEIRGLRERLSLKPYEGSYSVSVVEDAHMMTTEASNALLKILEEPPGGAFIILMTSAKEMLLPTVRSRCAEVRFFFLPVHDAEAILEEGAGADPDTAAFLSSFSQGSPGRALEMFESGIHERKDAILELLDAVAAEKRSSCLVWDTDTRDALIEDIDILLFLIREAAVMKEGLPGMARSSGLEDTRGCAYYRELSPGRLYRIIEELTGLRRALLGNVNPKIAAQALPSALKGRSAVSASPWTARAGR